VWHESSSLGAFENLSDGASGDDFLAWFLGALSVDADLTTLKSYVLLIDEINRGNIPKVDSLPGKGESFLLSGKEQKLVTYQRDLKLEKKKWRTLSKRVAHLTKVEQLVEEPLHCLELLEALSQVKDQDFRIEWPEGVKFQLKKQMGWKDFGLSVRRKKDWLEVDGQLDLSETERWNLAQLLERHREQKSRFIQLGDGEFLALSEEFHRRLDALQRAAKTQSSDSLELDPLSASVLLDDSHLVDSDEFWKNLQKRLEKSQSFKPKLPSTLKATLRPYQEEGFRWLASSAHRGVGCCLADDMGLGKTVQALALIASRANPKGKPTLIVAPTSVCFNWMDEVKRFTPDLRAHLFNQIDRETAFQGLHGNDLMITSYGLLVNEIERFRKVKWANLILDESQAIKNPTTKRFKAAVSLEADFRVATTGTPIENRIDEIWALFRFLNPGLLGTRKSFDKTYSGLDEMEEKRESLRRLLSPFILRRLKSQVLKDLPPRTDVTLKVEMSKEEMLHYESLRVHALERLETSEKSNAISILTELTRLRLSCCDPRLVDPKTKLESAKLKALLRLLRDLKDSGHRALVFSQFVGHLSLVKEELERLGLSYLYLDGNTPAKTRGKLVKQFQQGEEDFFLISLMAGGTGLNLTAANYVVHLDPWWNPAVEDQASDRAHRIGQKQPVTVYRLITKQTIEEKILELHKDKRELADTLLSGTDKAGKLSSEELLNLMRESVMTV
jgi:SNF2 family DNA or RNA helicase